MALFDAEHPIEAQAGNSTGLIFAFDSGQGLGCTAIYQGQDPASLIPFSVTLLVGFRKNA